MEVFILITEELIEAVWSLGLAKLFWFMYAY